MGISLQFLVGAPKEILDALSNINYDKLNSLIEKEADFSLHLQTKDRQTGDRLDDLYFTSDFLLVYQL